MGSVCSPTFKEYIFSWNSCDKLVSLTHPISPPFDDVSEILNLTAALLKPYFFINSFTSLKLTSKVNKISDTLN